MDYSDTIVIYTCDDAFNRTSETAVEKFNNTTVVNKGFSYNNLNQVTGIITMLRLFLGSVFFILVWD